jgi:ATP-binding cassette subfamily F protein 3
MKNQNPLLVLRNIAKDYTGDGLFSDVNLSIGEDDRIAIVGLNGTGKSTLLKIIVGEEEEDEGGLVKNKKLKIGYLPQETHWKSLKNSILEEIDSFDLKKQSSDNYKHKGLVKQLLEKFGFPKEGWEREIQTLSGGEKTKLALAKVLANSPNLLVLDEPTNHLDLETIE